MLTKLINREIENKKPHGTKSSLCFLRARK